MDRSIRERVLSACSHAEEKWENHIKSVVSYANVLSRKRDADTDICEIAAWLHDITKIRGDPFDHHITGAHEAARLLAASLPQQKVDAICSCILSHTSDPTYPALTCEEQIVASADALAHLDTLLFLVTDRLFLTPEKTFPSQEKILTKMQKTTDKLLLKEAQQMGSPKRHAIACLVESIFETKRRTFLQRSR